MEKDKVLKSLFAQKEHYKNKKEYWREKYQESNEEMEDLEEEKDYWEMIAMCGIL